MTIYRLRADMDNYAVLTVQDKDLSFSLQFDGRKLKDKWKPINAYREDRKQNKLLLSNMPGMEYHIPIFDEMSKKVLEKMIKNNVEFLELINSEKKLWIANVICILDCIDYDKSKYITFSNSNKIMWFECYYFRRKIIGNNKIFKLIDEPLSTPFVTEEFKKEVEDYKLTGFIFGKVWEG